MNNFFSIEGKRIDDLKSAKLPTKTDREFALTESGHVIVLDKCGNYTGSTGTYPAMIPPLSKGEFAKYILAIKSLDDGIDKINSVMNEVCQDNTYDPPTLKEELLELLILLFHDKKTDWIYYFIYDLDFGANWTESSVMEDGVPIPLRTPDDLYDILVGNMKLECQ